MPELHVPQVDALRVPRDARGDGGEVAEGAVELGGAVAGAGPGTGADGRESGQAGGQEGPQPAGPFRARCPHRARVLRCHPRQRRRAGSCGANRAHGHSQRQPSRAEPLGFKP